MQKPDLKNRDDIYKVVTSFYSKVREDEILAPFFTQIKDWDKHLEHISTFWQSHLFFNTKYTGNPIEAHVKVDKANNNSITEHHFGQWLNLWFNTIDALFEGENANILKFKARKMSTFIYLNIFTSRA